LAFWRIAQRIDAKKVPAWTRKLIRSLANRSGAAARLSVGPWGGTSAAIHGGAEKDYARLTPPLPLVRALRTWRLPDSDIHSNKWWTEGEKQEIKGVPEPDNLVPKAPRCVPLPEACQDFPVAELVLAFFVAMLFMKVLGLSQTSATMAPKRKRR